MTQTERILEKNLVTAGLSAAEWDAFRAGVKDRAFWSARVEQVRYLETAREGIADVLRNARTGEGTLKSRAHVVSDIMRAARELGIGTGAGDVTDPGSAARAALVVDTNAGLAAGYAAFAQGSAYGARMAFPAQELVRVEARDEERDWHAIWREHGGELYGGRMVALKGDPVWVGISRFGLPYPPFDYNSGMGLDEVSHEEAVALGLITANYTPPQDSPLESFNATLAADMTFSGPQDPGWLYLREVFGDQVLYQGGKITWQGDIILDTFKRRVAKDHVRGYLELGIPTHQAMRKFEEVPAPDAADFVKDKRLAFRYDDIAHITTRHVGANETHPYGVPLTANDIRLIPHIWREPDAVNVDKTTGAFLIDKKMSDGNVIRLVVVRTKGGLQFKTAYKVKWEERGNAIDKVMGDGYVL